MPTPSEIVGVIQKDGGLGGSFGVNFELIGEIEELVATGEVRP